MCAIAIAVHPRPASVVSFVTNFLPTYSWGA
jgi:hypothetical protein